MPISLRLLIVAALIPTVPLSAQQSTTTETAKDPTAESAEMKAQLDTIRGVEELGQLRNQVGELTLQNQQLMQRLLEATDKIDVMQQEVTALREGQEQAARRRSALPELRLVSQLRTDSIRRAEISVAGRTYRVLDGVPFRLQLSNGEVLLLSPSFEKDGTVKLKIDDLDPADLDETHLLSFRPSPPDPSEAKERARADRDRERTQQGR